MNLIAPLSEPRLRPLGWLCRFGWVSGVAALLVMGVGETMAAAAPGEARDPAFSREILPILSDHCFQCHGPDEKTRKGKLRLDTREGATRVREGAAAVVPGQSNRSTVIERILSTDPDEVMPPPSTKRSLDPRQIEALKQWIDRGAGWGVHWAFEPPRKSEPVLSEPSSWPVQELDRFVLAGLQRQKMAPAREADRVTLLRRVSLDLTGLPPTPEEVSAFVKDRRPNAYELQVDRLLASSAYGERMSWDWLDAARYADSNGYQGDSERTMWPWRDWVVEAFNRNLPFDTFTVWQLAGDLVPGAGFEQRLATGFLRNHMINGEGGRIPEENRVDYVMDMTETVGTVWLGLTMNCSRCHDHKFDPITKRDYFQLFAFFDQTPVTGAGGDPQTRPVVEAATEPQRAAVRMADERLSALRRELVDLELALFPRPAGQGIGASERFRGLDEKLRKLLEKGVEARGRAEMEELAKAFEASEPRWASALKEVRDAADNRARADRAIPRVMVMEDMAKPRASFMLDRGLYNKPGEPVSPGLIQSLAMGMTGPSGGGASNRLWLAEWIVSPEHPLTSRVIVNRFWQQVFGVGLVKTAEDFGVQGERPQHVALLDWLARDFQEHGWDVKRLMKQLVTSATYRQDSRVTAHLAEFDPENRMLARGPRFRMPSWMIRDQALSASGLLVRSEGGPGVLPHQPPGVWEEATFGAKKYSPDTGAGLYRRSLYTFWRRIVAPTAFFDAASRQTCSVKQPRTNTPLHALATLNDATYVEAARALALQVSRGGAGGAPGDAWVRQAFARVVSRPPTDAEVAVLLAGHERRRQRYGADPAQSQALAGSVLPAGMSAVELAARTSVCLVILNMDEAVTKE